MGHHPQPVRCRRWIFVCHFSQSLSAFAKKRNLSAKWHWAKSSSRFCDTPGRRFFASATLRLPGGSVVRSFEIPPHTFVKQTRKDGESETPGYAPERQACAA
jgi:hypothetical protein